MLCIVAKLPEKGQQHLHPEGNRVDTRVSQPCSSHANHTGCPSKVANKGTESGRGSFDKNRTHNNAQCGLHQAHEQGQLPLGHKLERRWEYE